MDGSSVLVMFLAVFPTLCKALRLRAVQLPYQAVMQPVRILSGAPVEVAEYPGIHVEPPQPAEIEEPLSSNTKMYGL